MKKLNKVYNKCDICIAITKAMIKVFNELSWEEGQQFIKVSMMGIIGTLVCNITVILPVVLSNMKRIKRYDVTVY